MPCGFNKHAVKLRMHKAVPYCYINQLLSDIMTGKILQRSSLISINKHFRHRQAGESVVHWMYNIGYNFSKFCVNATQHFSNKY